MHYYVRPSFDPQRADEIIGPLSLVQVNELVENGPVTRHWLVLAVNERLQVSVPDLAENEWYPITALPGVIGFAEEALPPSEHASVPTHTGRELPARHDCWVIYWTRDRGLGACIRFC